MKKMSILAVLLVAVVVTTFSVSGTYAKYTSKIDTTDEARIAKWEFGAAKVNDDNTTTALSTTQTNTIDLFASSYKWNGDKYVEAINGTDKVVAPGTEGEYTFKLVGNMEVRYNLDFKLAVENDFVVYYDIDANGNVINTSNTKGSQAKEYHPLRFSVLYTDNAGKEHTDITDVTTAGLVAGLKAYSEKIAAKGFGPGAMRQQFKISWKWNAVNEGMDGLTADQANALDTWAGQNMSAATDKVVMDLTITATQIAENHSK